MRPEDVEGLTVGGLLDLVTERRPENDALVYVGVPGAGVRALVAEGSVGRAALAREVNFREHVLHAAQ